MQTEPIIIDPLRLRDINDICDIEKRSFTTPWSKNAFFTELLENERAYYLAAKAGDRTVGYIGVWLIAGEGHITNVAVHPDYRGAGIGYRLMCAVEHLITVKGGTRMTLEVRPSNDVARSLYAKLGYVVAGRRPRYYQDNNEDALIMWKELLGGREGIT